jgi:glucoamylase
MDQTAMPVMLGWQLWRHGLLSDADVERSYWAHLKPAAEFLANGGTVDLVFQDGNTDRYLIDTPWTRQERWEEEEGYSPSTTAAIVAGLISAAEMAREVGGAEIGAAEHYERKADAIVTGLASTMMTTNGPLGNGRYYMRLDLDGDPNNGNTYEINNCGSNRPACSHDERQVLDPGFLELVRYGVRKADDPAIRDSLPEVDDLGLPDDQRLRYQFTVGANTFEGWRRYSFDRYGERTDDGSNFRGDHLANRGRVWPILTGERGHYELAFAMLDGTLSASEEANVRHYVAAMEHFANNGLMLPEQVWDGVGSNVTHDFTLGKGTNGATPLAWSHAEYAKLVRSLRDRKIWDANAGVSARFAGR